VAKQMIDSTLRQQIAQWTRAALGHLVEDDGIIDAVAPIENSLNRQRSACRRRFIVRIADLSANGNPRLCCSSSLSANANPTTYPGYFVHLHDDPEAANPRVAEPGVMGYSRGRGADQCDTLAPK
jgi:hypothetical protein